MGEHGQGNVATIVGVGEAAANLRFEGVTFRAVRMRPARPVELYLAWRRDNDNPALQSFLDTARTFRKNEKGSRRRSYR